MAIDFSTYRPPGVYTEAVPGPQIAVQSTLPTSVGLFGMSVGYRSFVESVEIVPDNAENQPQLNDPLSQKGIITSTLVVKNPETGLPYTKDADYTIERLSAGDDATVNTRDDLYTIKRVADGTMDPESVVQVSYDYTDAAFFDPVIFYDYDDVRDRYGPAFNTTKQTINGVNPGEVMSELTLAAKFAFLHGAYQVICVAVDKGSHTVPTAQDYGDALDKFKDEEMVAVVVPATGRQDVHELVRAHVDVQSKNKYERTAILARDGSVVGVSSSTLHQNASVVKNQRIAMVSPAKFSYYSPELSDTVKIGGQYVAAALAGIAVSMNTAIPLTRKALYGFTEAWPGPGDKGREGEKDLDTRKGLLVVERTRRQQMQVRHGVTTDPTDLLTREWSIIRQQDAMVYRIRDYLDNDNLIGQPIYDTTLINVKASAEAALQSLKRDQVIRDYTGLKVRQLETLPDVIEVRYSWLPAYPLNYILVRYAVSLPSGDVSLVSA